jgi:DNA adenine methylase
VAALDYSPATFAAAAVGEPADAMDGAVRFVVRRRMSRGGLESHFAWSERLRGGRPGDLNAWETIKVESPRVADRLRGVERCQAPAVEVIREHDSPGTFHYCDPPYLHETRTARGAYRYEMTTAKHR